MPKHQPRFADNTFERHLVTKATVMKYLVTGGAGFIGSNLVRALLAQGHAVRVLDNFSTGNEQNLSDIQNDIELVEGDIRDYWVVASVVKGIDCVSHQAALPSVPKSITNPLTANCINTDGTLNMLEASRLAGVKRFVYASSSAVYGESPTLPKHEEMIPDPLSPYAITKLTGEYYCRVYSQLYRFPAVALRYFNIFGPRQDPRSEYAPVVPRFINRLLANQPPTVYGDGEQSRDFTFIDSAVQANLLAFRTDAMVGGVFNVGGGHQFTLNQLLDRLRSIIGVSTKALYEPAREGDIRHSFASIDKITKCGYKPGPSFEEALRKTVDFFAAEQNVRVPVSR
jgi:nucleoside-diphosphate-sugar epimerase